MQCNRWIQGLFIVLMTVMMSACGGGGGGDTVEPDIYLSGMIARSISCGSIYTPPMVSAIDDVDGPVAVTQTGSIDTNHAGVQTVTYSAQDSAGNVGTYDLNVEVKTFLHNGIEYCTVKSPYTDAIWLDRNLGARMVCSKSRDDAGEAFTDATYIADQEACFGDYYQWGRDADGHEDKESTSLDVSAASQAANVSNVGHGNFIKSNSTYSDDWAKAADGDGSIRQANWSATDDSSVCPTGFRVSTIAELRAELLDAGSAEIQNRDDAYNSFLKLPSAGYRFYSSGSMRAVGSWGRVWSSSASGSYASRLSFGLDFADWGGHGDRATGRSVRCLRD